LAQKVVTKYLIACDHFTDVLLTAIHLSSGQPARATELETLTITNGFRSRSIYFSRGRETKTPNKNKNKNKNKKKNKKKKKEV